MIADTSFLIDIMKSDKEAIKKAEEIDMFLLPIYFTHTYMCVKHINVLLYHDSRNAVIS